MWIRADPDQQCWLFIPLLCLDNRGNPDGVGGEVCLQVQRARPPGIHVLRNLVQKTRS